MKEEEDGETNRGFATKENIMALQPENRTGNIFPVHADLRQRVGTENVLRWALEAPQTLEAPIAEQLKPDFLGFRPQMLLTLMSFSYATGYYGSEDIERAFRFDRTVRYICARSFPEAVVIRKFRRQYRAALDQCLSYVLQEAAAELGIPDGPELEPQIVSTTREKIELAVIMDRD
ncbi:MAG: transposase [Verrucomicrobia subdivision 3 bacterium]|nr:transposase [Limisphaerales bacterium]